MQLQFLGAAGTVTGSKFLLTLGESRILVDCGLFQGMKELRERNWSNLPLPGSEIDAVILTHAHIDHSGYLPRLVAQGFDGPIHATEATTDLCSILLPDSGRLQEEDARYANRKGYSRHRPARPLYTEKEAQQTLEHFTPVDFHSPFSVGDAEVRMTPAGHILGAASARIAHDGRSITFSGDLGRFDDPLMHPPEVPPASDWIVMESTYGDRTHRDGDPVSFLAPVIRRTLERGGIVLIPSFAVGRAQLMLYCLWRLFEKGEVPRVPVYLNSPMATDVTRLYRHRHTLHKLTPETLRDAFGIAHTVASIEESKDLNQRRDPAIIVSASGMATGGRVLHHLRSLAPEPRNTILLPSYQAPGTRGAAMLEGVESIRIHGGQVPLRAEVVQLDMFSAHGDRDDLIRWLGRAPAPPRHVFLVHGEPEPARALRGAIEEGLGFPAHVPEQHERVTLEPGSEPLGVV